MKVYLLMSAYEDYVTSHFYGVYSSEEKALEKIKEIYIKNEYYDTITLRDFTDYEFTIIPFIVDKDKEMN